MLQASALHADFRLNCGCGDSNCSSCHADIPVANCGDSDCNSCYCLIPITENSALLMLSVGRVRIVLSLAAGQIAGGFVLLA